MLFVRSKKNCQLLANSDIFLGLFKLSKQIMFDQSFILTINNHKKCYITAKIQIWIFSDLGIIKEFLTEYSPFF